jgi:hypothetical protein
MIGITFSQVTGTRQVLIEAWLCGACVATVTRLAPDSTQYPENYFDTPEVQATMIDLAQPTIDRLQEHFKK